MATDDPACTLGDVVELPDTLAEVEVKAWIDSRVQLEVTRLREQGARAIVVPVNNMSIYREDGQIVNRVEVATTFDFNKVTMLLVSDETACWVKPGYAYVNIVLFTEKPVPLLLPYLFDKAHQADNSLKEWAFINKNLELSRHSVDALQEVTE